MIHTAPRKCVPWTEIRVPMQCQDMALACITKASESAQRTQEVWWQQFKGCSELLPTAIPLSLKLSVVSKLCVCTAASQRRLDLLMIIMPPVSLLNYNSVNTKTPKVPGCFIALTIFQNKQGLLLPTLPCYTSWFTPLPHSVRATAFPSLFEQ